MTVTDEARFSQAAALVRPLAVCAAAALVSAGALSVPGLTLRSSFLLNLYSRPLLAQAVASLLLAAFGAAALLLVVRGRQSDTGQADARRADTGVAGNAAGRAAGWPQTVLAVLLCVPAATIVLVFWPRWESPVPAGGFAGASMALLFATPWLIAARAMAAIPPDRLPEADDLRALLLIPVLVLAADAVVLVIAGLGVGNLAWAQSVIAMVLLALCAELVLRAVGARFLPPPAQAKARAQVASLIAQALSSRALSPAGVAVVVRSQFGLDFSRSWALHFVRAAAVPVVLLMLGVCWFLTGVTRVDLDQRGSYERFGRAVAMLSSGLHVGLPWPFGVVRHQELGGVHEVMISNTPQAAGTDAGPAEGPAPAAANRLWDSEQASDVSYLIASGTADRQSFETVSASLRVLYRIGLTDVAAREALYHQADPDGLVRALAGRVLAAFFASRTLPHVLGENQAVMASELKRDLQANLDSLQTGIEVLAVIIETIHPPAGAAPAYRNVQAAEIEASTDIASEQGRAETTRSVAQMHAHTQTNDAAAEAARIESAARVDLTNIKADDHPYRAAAAPFVLERYFSALMAVLPGTPLEIVDSRLSGDSLPTIDLRPPGFDTFAAHDGQPSSGRAP